MEIKIFFYEPSKRNSSMKIIYFITGLKIGGAEAITIDLANAMSLQGHNISIIYLTGANELSHRILPSVQVIGLNMKKNLRGFIKAQSMAGILLKKEKPDVVHGNMFHANMFVRLLRLHSSIKLLITTEHNKFIGENSRMWLYRITDFLSDINTNVSEEATGYFLAKRAFSVKKSLTMYNGICLSNFQRNPIARKLIRQRYDIEDTSFLFLNVGRLTDAKNQIGLLKAFTTVSEKKPNAKLMILGNGELKDDLQCFIREYSLEQRVILVSAQLNVADYYNAADCFVLSSAWEGFGLVLVEAMACELPVITTDAGGCAEVVKNRDYILPVNNKKLLVERMQMVYDMSLEERKALGEENRKLSERFDMKKIASQWIELYINKHY